MSNQKMLNALSYFSLFFAPILIPLVIWIFGATKNVKHHAKVALITHILPFVGLGLIGVIMSFFSVGTNSMHTAPFILFGLIVTFLIMTFVLIIFNIIRGIQALVNDNVD